MSTSQICVGFVFTNFNNSQLTVNALRSIRENSNGAKTFSIIVDNNSVDDEQKFLREELSGCSDVEVISNQSNLGYFSGLNVGIREMRRRLPDFDFLIIGNNDLIFAEEFFSTLQADRIHLKSNLIVCPDLITLDNTHQNPHVLSGISRFREMIWDLYFSNYHAARLISRISTSLKKWVERSDYKHHELNGFIYQGYGACYIVTQNFFDKFDDLWAPGFLMGEEFYLATQLESIGHKMYYWPQLKVLHHDHATVSKIPSRKLWEYSREYHRIYRHFINPYHLSMRTPETIQSYQSKNQRSTST